MDLYLIRHADALPLGAGGSSTDEERPLSPKGITQCAQLADALLRGGVSLTLLASSPLKRGMQTAEEILKVWSGDKPRWVQCDALAPGGKPRSVNQFLLEHDVPSIALVGHNPDLSVFGGWLLGSRKIQLHLAKGAVAHFQFAKHPGKGLGTLTWLITPRWYLAK